MKLSSRADPGARRVVRRARPHPVAWIALALVALAGAVVPVMPASATSPGSVSGFTLGTTYTVSEAAGERVYTFTSGTGSFTPATALTGVQVLVVGGGGGGGGIGTNTNRAAGGGGGGGVVALTGGNAISLTSGQAYTVTVGNGGAAGTSSAAGGQGQNSFFGTYKIGRAHV